MTHEFNLLDAPWILVSGSEGTEEVSLLTLFEEAGSIRSLGGELPTVDMAILRLALAILARAVAEDRSEDEAEELWAEWWEARRLPLPAIQEYTARHRDRFDLLSPDKPFMQTPSLTSMKDGTSGLVKLIGEVPDGDKVFSMRHGRALTELTLAEAARWLVHCQAFDTSGIKTGVRGDERVKGGKTYPLGNAYTGSLGLVIAQGDTLLETLLLNLCLDRVSTEDSAFWERDVLEPGVALDHPQPTGMADLFVWPNRRIRLVTNAEQDRVVDVVVTYGDTIRPENLQGMETMSAFKHSQNLSRKAGGPVYWPHRHNPERAIWRGLEAMVVGSKGGDTFAPPHVLEWLGRLSGDALERGKPIDLRTVGVEYGPQSATIDQLVDDSLRGTIAALTRPELFQLALHQAQLCDELASAYNRFNRNLHIASGGDPTLKVSEHFVTAYTAFDVEFREWFRGLGADTDESAARAAFQQRARNRAHQLGRHAASLAGPAALRGVHDEAYRNISQFGILNTATALNAYQAAVRRLTPLADRSATTQESA